MKKSKQPLQIPKRAYYRQDLTQVMEYFFNQYRRTQFVMYLFILAWRIDPNAPQKAQDSIFSWAASAWVLEGRQDLQTQLQQFKTQHTLSTEVEDFFNRSKNKRMLMACVYRSLEDSEFWCEIETVCKNTLKAYYQNKSLCLEMCELHFSFMGLDGYFMLEPAYYSGVTAFQYVLRQHLEQQEAVWQQTKQKSLKTNTTQKHT